jgi:hypothetical protein
MNSDAAAVARSGVSLARAGEPAGTATGTTPEAVASPSLARFFPEF